MEVAPGSKGDTGGMAAVAVGSAPVAEALDGTASVSPVPHALQNGPGVGFSVPQ